MKKALTTLAVALLLLTALSIAPGGNGVALAQNRHVYLEEFTGSWCGWCPRGAYAIQTLATKYPGKVFAISIHAQNGDPMENAQGDSLVAATGFASQGLSGFPDGWTARMPFAGTWNVDPSTWVNPLPGISSGSGVGIVDTLVNQTAQAQVTLSNVSFDLSTHMITAQVSATFASAMTGNFRLNIMVAEDSVSGPSGSLYDQHNYYSSSSNGASYPNSPFYSLPAVIPGWMHMNVFREAVAGIHGLAGIIPSTTVPGTAYSKTFSFLLPSTITNPNHVHLIALVHEYDATNASKNEVFDAASAPLVSSPVTVNAPLDVSIDDVQYMTAKSEGTSSFTISVTNNSSTSASVTPSLDAGSALPTGWSVQFAPPVLTVGGGQTGSESITVTAPKQSNYIQPTIDFVPTESGAFAPSSSIYFGMLSDNTKNAVFFPSSPDVASIVGLPASMTQNTAAIPANDQTLQSYDPGSFDVLIFSNYWLLDQDGSLSGVPTPVMSYIDNALSNGQKIFISTDMGGYYAFTGGVPATETDALQGFFLDTLGLSYRTSKSRVNSSNQLLSFDLAGTSDPIATGLGTIVANSTGMVQYSTETAIFGLAAGSPSVPLFYSDGAKTNDVAFKYDDTATGAKLIYLGFTLNSLANQKTADTIFARSMSWLLAAPAAAVAVTSSSPQQFTASANPFHGATQISYTAGTDERDVSFSAFDLLGREIAALPVKAASGTTYSTTFDASTLPAGTYTIVMHSSTGTKELRVVNQ